MVTGEKTHPLQVMQPGEALMRWDGGERLAVAHARKWSRYSLHASVHSVKLVNWTRATRCVGLGTYLHTQIRVRAISASP